MNKHYRVYWEKLLETVAFSYGKVSLYELVQKEHKHFHPSGKLSPSKEDCMLTDRMLKLCDLIGIPLLDHVIVGGDNSSYFSFKEKEMLNFEKNKYIVDYHDIEFPEVAVAEETPPIRHRRR